MKEMSEDEKIRFFCEVYQIEEPERLKRLYDIDELWLNMPAQPTQAEKQALQELIGVQGVSGYMDYVRSNNTFELMMQWREKTGNL
ncbi:MAG: hypothetical protein OHK0053_26230 [Microscillaceae bacterium]